MNSYTGVDSIDHLLNEEAEESTNDRGNRLLETFYSADRYIFDFHPGFLREWIQFDTDQDASYFGTWVHKAKRLVLTYCEGDIHLVICEDDEHYDAEVGSMCRFYTPAPAFKTLDLENGVCTEVYQDQLQYFIDPERGRQYAVRFVDQDKDREAEC